MDEGILKKLYEPFELKSRQGQGNKTFKYVPSEDIVDRMNKVFKCSWSTEVRESTVVEDQVVIRVAVTIKDPDAAEYYVQEGYASHTIMRYTRGDNVGKSIEIGNAYKSAMSKAIKAAVAKWGVGLYLEKDMSEDFSDEVDMPSQSIGASMPPFSTGGPTSSPKAVIKESPADPIIPVFDNEPLVTGKSSDGFNPPIPPVDDSFTSPVKTEGFVPLTDVQKVAINSLSELKSISLGELSSKVLGRVLKQLDDTISYQEAVQLIKYGNNLELRSGQ